MNVGHTPHVERAVRLVLAGKSRTEACRLTKCSERALRMALRKAGVAPLAPGGRPVAST